MRLKEFQVQNFRSIVDSGVIKVEEITALIGPNEAGKSSILEGLSSISFESHYQYFDLTQLNGTLKKYNDSELKPEEIPIVLCKFELSQDDLQELKSVLNGNQIGIPVNTEKESSGPQEKEVHVDNIEVCKYFDESYVLTISDKKFKLPPFDLCKTSQNKLGTEFTNLKSKVEPHFQRPPNQPFRQQFNEFMEEADEGSSHLANINGAKQLLSKLETFQSLGIDQPLKNEIIEASKRINQLIDKSLPETKIEAILFQYLLLRMPRTVYFKTYDRLEDEVSISELKQNPTAHKTFLNFLKLAEIKLETVERLTDEKKIQVYIESGCGKATKLLREAWHQEVLDVELRYSTGRFMVFTKNSKAVETLLPPSLGSEGFQWFLGFYINFGAATNAEYKRAILLLDDPGVFLHPKGHKDLLGLFEGYIDNDVTTIYSTHLPFLIPKNNLKRLRLVTKLDQAHTKVTEKFYAVEDKDILYPLRAALGVTLADSLFVGEKTIITEGLSDRILLNGMLEEFGNRSIKNLDPNKIGILAGPGAKGTKQYALMLWIENLPYVVVLDNDDEGREAKGELIKVGIPEEKIRLLSSAYDEELQDFDIEDLFPLEVYAEAFFEVHGRAINLKKDEVLAAFTKGKSKVNNKAKNLLKSCKYDLDKIRIAYEMMRIMNSREQLDKKTIKIFSDLFDALDKILGIYEKR